MPQCKLFCYMIKFTIVTITYNAAAVLGKTLNSVLGQTYRDIEHLIVDGNSTDTTVSIARQYAQDNEAKDTGHHIIITSEPDKGLYDAMNKGLQQAKGQYIVFLNAGDFFPDNDVLQHIADAAAEAGDGEPLPAVLYGDTDIVDAEGNFLFHRQLTPPHRLSWRSFMRGMLVCHQAFYARVDIARDIPYNLKYRYSADVDWCIKVMKKASQLHLPLKRVNGVIVNYTREGQTTLHHRASLIERYHVMVSHYGWFTTCVMHVYFAFRMGIEILKKR